MLWKCWVGSLIGGVEKDDEGNIPRDRSALSWDLWLMSLFKEERAFSIYICLFMEPVLFLRIGATTQEKRFYSRVVAR